LTGLNCILVSYSSKIIIRSFILFKSIGQERTYQVEIDGEIYDLIIKDQLVTVNGKEIRATLSETDPGTFVLNLGNQKLEVFSGERNSENKSAISLSINNRSRELIVKDETQILLDSYKNESEGDSGTQAINAPMPGLVLKILVSPGDEVEKGDGLLILEAMKMENEIKAAQKAVVEEILVSNSQAVSKGEKMLVLHLDV